MAGGKQSSVRFGAVLVACLAAALVQTSLAATSHTVGGNSGWTIPSSSTLYSTWASQQTFNVGDSLVFNFQTGTHTVAEVSKSAYDACTTTNPISTATTGPATIKIATAGTHYYICTISGHCGAGQKLAITATATSSTAPTAAPTSAPTSSTPSAAPAASPTSTPSAAPTSAPSAAPTSAPTATPTAAPTSSPTTAPTPSSSGGTATTPSGATTPGASTVPSAGSPSGGAAASPPSSATMAGVGLVMPLIMIAAAFLV